MNNHEYLTVEYDIISTSIKEALSLTVESNNFYKLIKDVYNMDFIGIRKTIKEFLNRTKYLVKPIKFEKLNKEFINYTNQYNTISAKLTNEIIDPIDLFYNHIKGVYEEDLTTFSKVFLNLNF